MSCLAQSLIKNDAKDGFTLNPDDWHLIAPKGEFDHPDVGVQVLDQTALDSIISAFNRDAGKKNFPGLRVDYDHFSYDRQQSSRAAGWIRAIENRSDGIYARIAWSKSGKDAVEGGDFRLVSPVFSDLTQIAPNRVRPGRIDSLALTNNPNIDSIPPLSNRSINQPSNMESIASALSLPKDANEATILGAVTKLANRATQAESRLTDLQKEVDTLSSEQIERDLEPLKNRLEEPKVGHWRQLLKNDRKGALPALKDLIDSLGAKKEAKKSFNRADTGNPDSGGEPRKDLNEPGAAAKIMNRAREIQKSEGVNFNEAWRRAASETVTAA